MITLTKEQLIIIANNHVDNFTRLIEHYVLNTPVGKNVNLIECRMYLKIWSDVLTALMTNENIPPSGAIEIKDALHSGEYTDIVPGSDTNWTFEYNGEVL